MKITSEVKHITPAMALKILKTNGANRSWDRSWSLVLAGAMARNEWRLNGEAIKLDEDDNMLDGLHRLNAVVMAEELGVKSVPFLVVSGLPRAIFDTLDQGKRRTASHVMQIAGKKHAVTLAAAARTLHWMTHGKPFGSTLTTQQIERVVEEYPTIQFWTNEFVSSKANRIVTAGFVAVLTLGALNHSDDIAATFLRKVATGASLEQGDPCLLLREKMIEAKSSPSRRLRQSVAFGYVIKAWNAYVEGRKIVLLRISSEESFPVMK